MLRKAKHPKFNMKVLKNTTVA